MIIYKKKYKKKEIIEILEKHKENNLNIWDLLVLIGFDVIDINFFYINEIKGKVRYNKQNY